MEGWKDGFSVEQVYNMCSRRYISVVSVCKYIYEYGGLPQPVRTNILTEKTVLVCRSFDLSTMLCIVMDLLFF